MKNVKSLFVIFFISLLTACAEVSMHHSEVTGVEFPDNKKVINDIFVIDKKPVVRYEKVTVFDGQELVFLGPDEFVIQFKEGSFFEDSDQALLRKQRKLIESQGIRGEQSGIYPSKDGVVILKVSREKAKGIKVGTEFKYSVWVNGVELDPIGRYGGDER